ncbi:unnamed protein product [Pleuronectes platessa]|uniref:Uncharacterized protein n=1 Tax=Pleuronectes platessa TaxID=8262 RepID=A0A9N7ZC28_PLEPL|nr:unnamed protein product [Pleuronectes platessa]
MPLRDLWHEDDTATNLLDAHSKVDQTIGGKNGTNRESCSSLLAWINFCFVGEKFFQRGERLFLKTRLQLHRLEGDTFGEPGCDNTRAPLPSAAAQSDG